MKTVQMIPRFLFAFFFMVTGIGVREVWQFHHTYILNDLRVVSQTSNDRFEFQKEKKGKPIGQVFSLKFCQDFIPKLETGNYIEILVYEERFNCESIANKKLGIITDKN